MPLNTILSDSYRTFRESVLSTPLSLLHSQSRYRTALLSRLIADDGLRTYYYGMGVDDTDVRTFLAGFIHDISEQMPNFGGRVSQVGMERPDDHPKLLAALIEDVAHLSDEPFVLLIDEFDRADVADDLEKFLEALIENAPAHCHIVLSGRGLPRLPWMALIARRKAIMLRDAEIIRRNFYDNQSLDNPRLRLTGFGQGEVNLDGRVVTGWEGHLPRLLLFFALERPYTTRSEMCVEFWPELQVDQAVNVFHVTKRRLHKALDGIGNDILIHVGSYYRIIADLTLHYDVDDFVGAILAGRLAEDPAERLAAWNRVIELHAHPFLQGHPEKWIVRRRHDYLTGWIEAMTGIAAQRHAEGRTENALLLYQKAVGEDVRRQDIHRQIMALYSELGRRSEIQTYYGRMRDDLKAAGTAIEGETKSLYETLMAAD